MTPRTNVLLSVAAQTGAVNGNWYSAPDGNRLYVPFEIFISGTSATWILEGVNDISDTASPVQIDTGTASKALEAQRFKFYRFRLSAATAANAKCRTDLVMRQAA
jgi:hypothetical protein